MAKVIYIDIPQKEEKKKVQFTHYMTDTGWIEDKCIPNGAKLIYLGKCSIDGDMFASITATIDIYKGHLNSGEY